MMIGWIETLLDFDFDVVHIPGILNKFPDLLSRLYLPSQDSYKLVEDNVPSKLDNRNKKRVIAKRKKYSRDKIINVLATKLVGTKNELTDYMTPPEEERDAILRETHSFGHYGYQAIVRDIHSRGMHWTNIYDEAKSIIVDTLLRIIHKVMEVLKLVVNLSDDYTNKEKYPFPKDVITIKELEERVNYMENVIFPAINERTQKINEGLNSRSGKLAPLYEGPYTVVRKNKGGSYELKDEQNELMHRNYTPSELKIVHIDESNIEDEYYELEDIRDHRGPSGNREYLVKWAGYGERASTWQKAGDFTDPTIIQKYWDKQDELKVRT
ncbi:hypothetical protein G6F60_012563 [Rhizopus arrhizus]|nr:hypothetical protein G6F60_012563 [Rhizopus arrhizus]